MSTDCFAARLAEFLNAYAGPVFTVPGTQNIFLLNEFSTAGLELVNGSSELAASFMANGFARTGSKPAVLMTIAGPGITTAITGIAEAHHDSAPILVVVVEGQDKQRQFDLQRLDLRSMLTPVCKSFFSVDDSQSAAAVTAEAFAAVTCGEPGPVVLHICAELLHEHCAPIEIPEAAAAACPDFSQLAKRIKASRKPLFFLGAGALGCASELEDLAENHGLPLVLNTSGRGILPDSHANNLSYDFSFGAGPRMRALFEAADLIVVIGAKLSHNGTAGFDLPLPKDKLLRIDTDRAVLDANYPASLSLQVSALEAVTGLGALLGDYRSSWSDSELVERRAALADEAASLAPRPPKLAGLQAEDFFGSLRNACSRDTLFCADSGYHQALLRQHLEVFSPRTLIIPSDFQSMGFGLPAAIGAAYSQGSSRCAAVVGDGGFLMTAAEVACAVHNQLNLSVLVFRDNWYGLIRLQQAATFGRTPATALPDYSVEKIAEAYGANYIKLDNPTQGDWQKVFPRSGVVIAEVPVGKMPGLAAKQAGRAVKEQIRSTLGQQTIESLKKFLGH